MEKDITLHERLVAIQSGLKAPKDQYNFFGKYKYRSAENILEAVKPLLKANGCKLTVMDEIVQIGERYYVKAIATISDGSQSLSVCAYAREAETKAGMDCSQITGAASSYARKYALSGLFAIDDNKDADALNTSPEYTAREDGEAPVKKAAGNKGKPLVTEGNELWGKAVEYCLEHGVQAVALRKWYDISDRDCETIDNITSFAADLEGEG